MKRFYKDAAAVQGSDGYEIHLDGRPVKTPLGHVLTVPTAALADALCGEWQAQAEQIVPDSMPLTQIASTARDRIGPDRAAIHAMVIAYLDTDLLCYRVDAPSELALFQKESWDPLLEWFVGRFEIRLSITTGLVALKQPLKAKEAVNAYLDSLDDLRFTVLQLVTSLTGSLVLALAFVDGALAAEDAFDLAHVDERHKAKIYNEDFYGAAPNEEQKRAAIKRDLEAAAAILRHLN